MIIFLCKNLKLSLFLCLLFFSIFNYAEADECSDTHDGWSCRCNREFWDTSRCNGNRSLCHSGLCEADNVRCCAPEASVNGPELTIDGDTNPPDTSSPDTNPPDTSSTDTSPTNGSGGGTEVIRLQSPISIQSPLELAATIVRFNVIIIGLVAVVAMIYAGILYFTSGGNEQQAEKAKKTITYVVIGLVVAILAYVIINTLIGAIGG